MRRTIFLVCLALALAAVIGLALALRHGEIAPIATPDPGSFDADLIERGELLASVGGCASCHGGKGEGLIGGVRLETPFGAIYSTNITPDPETGIGTWSRDAFRRALREGIDRGGNHLYPAFPYDHYTLASDDDIEAIHAFLMSRPAQRAEAARNELAFPFNIRLLMAGWNLLFLDHGPFLPDPARGEAWNRGAYLVEGLGHCAACHSPRNAFGARDRARDYSGASAEGWWSPALDAASPAPMPWNEDALINYLYDGWDEDHGIAAGPMAEVVTNIGALAEDDMQAIAVYLLSLQAGRPGGEEAGQTALDFAEEMRFGSGLAPGPPSDPASLRGHATFDARCVNCHRSGSESVPLALTTSVAGADPRNFIHIVLEGVTPSENAYFVRPMPGFAQLTDDEVADLAAFVRARFSRGAPWPDLPAVVNGVRQAQSAGNP